MNKKKLELKDYLLISFICVLFGVFYLLAVYAGGALSAVLAPVFTLYLIRKPGVGIITEIIAAVIEVLLGNMFGIIVVVSAFIQGLGIEIAFMTKKYSDITYGTTMLGAVITTIFTLLWTGFRSNYLALDWKLVVAIFVIRLVSALFFTGFVSKLLCDQMVKSGVIKVRG